VALGLGEAGATVYVTGRSRQDIHSTADEVTKLGGERITVRCDHRDDEQVEALFEKIRAQFLRGAWTSWSITFGVATKG
jgi:NAD(P)-dependent dehydrogenase (short-subunit alcohol dehydrogenase family)